ncbi:MAG: hypothetical protein HYX34_00325 [Actinobacteria bacterium]|nr:hypothetical protein [Actinomycetota bacterium]
MALAGTAWSGSVSLRPAYPDVAWNDWALWRVEHHTDQPVCGAVHPSHPGCTCRAVLGHVGPHVPVTNALAVRHKLRLVPVVQMGSAGDVLDEQDELGSV